MLKNNRPAFVWEGLSCTFLSEMWKKNELVMFVSLSVCLSVCTYDICIYLYIYIHMHIYLYICINVCIYYGLWCTILLLYIYVYNMYYYIYIWSLCALTCWMGSEAHYPFTVTEHGHCDCVYNWRWKNQWELKFSSKFRYEKIIRHVEFQYPGITTLKPSRLVHFWKLYWNKN